MGFVSAVAFNPRGRLYYVDPGELRPSVGEPVLVAVDDGAEVARFVWGPGWVDAALTALPALLGLAGPADLARDERHRELRRAALRALRRGVRAHNLDMQVLAVDYLASEQRYLAYFSAPARVDFRALHREVSRTLGARLELRQLSDRDRAKITGGIGSCGRDLCCATFLRDFEPVSVRMARDQGLPDNPLRISGACGRLMCCLAYEDPLYAQFTARAPRLRERVDTPEGPGVVVAHSVPAESVVVALDGSARRCACPVASVCSARAAADASREAPVSRE